MIQSTSNVDHLVCHTTPELCVTIAGRVADMTVQAHCRGAVDHGERDHLRRRFLNETMVEK